MTRFRLVLVSAAGLITLLAFTAASVLGEDNRLPAEVAKMLAKGESFTLLSLDPKGLARQEGEAEKGFHSYEVLGQTEIKDAKRREKLVKSLVNGINASDGVVAACFNPRHGIRVKSGDKTVDMVICFECLSITVYSPERSSVLTTNSPAATFVEAVKAAGLKAPTD